MWLAVEEPALEEREDFLACERPGVGNAPVLLEHAHVVLQRIVGPVESVAELVALEDHVLRPGLVGLAVLRVDRPSHRPHRAGTALDPDDDALLLPDVVDTHEDPLRVSRLARATSHQQGYNRVSGPCSRTSSRSCSLEAPPRS